MTSDPGTSSLATPFCPTYNLFFDPSREPEEFMYEFNKSIQEELNDDDKLLIGPKMEDSDMFYNTMHYMEELNKNVHIEKIHKVRDDILLIEIIE